MKKAQVADGLGFGLIGYGGSFGMGKCHIGGCIAAGMKLVGIVEIDKARREAAAAENPGVDVYADPAALLKRKDLGLVVIITPHNSHAALALQALKAGKHVVCEKPFCLTTAECDRMIAEARRRKLLVTAYHNRHWDGSILTAREMIREKGAVGEIVRVRASACNFGNPGDWWRASRSISGGILYDWGVHLLEYSFQLIDDEMTEVTGFATSGYWGSRTKWGTDTNEDEASAIIRFRGGVRLELVVSNVDHQPSPWPLEIRGTDGAYLMGHDRYEIHRLNKDGETIVRGRNRASDWGRFYGNIAGFLAGRERLVITPEWARRPVHAIDLAGRSAREKRSLRVKYG